MGKLGHRFNLKPPCVGLFGPVSGREKGRESSALIIANHYETPGSKLAVIRNARCGVEDVAELIGRRARCDHVARLARAARREESGGGGEIVEHGSGR